MNPPGEWHTATTESATTDTEKLRRELKDAPRELVDWEASCLKNISDLLDSLDKARVRWESIGNDLQDARTRLQRVQEERDLLAESHTDADKARSEIQQMRDELEEVRRERDRTAEELVVTKEQLEAHLTEQANGIASVETQLTELTEQHASLKEEGVSLSEQLAVLREENEALEQRLVERKGETESWQRRHEALETSEQQMRRLMEKRDAELADTKGRLIEADLTIEEEREKRIAAERDTASADELKKLQEKMEKLDKEHEQNLVMLFDQRTKTTRLEDKLEEAESHERARVKKIITKIHKELDAAGAPSGPDASFGERIRELKKKLS